MTDGILDGLMDVQEESFEKILITLLDEENVAMKTEIERPINLARLKILDICLENEVMFKSAKVISNFIDNYLIYMVSNKRQSRKEIIQALTEGLKQERTIGEKLTKTPG